MNYADSYADCLPPDDSRAQALEDAVELACVALERDRLEVRDIVVSALLADAEHDAGELAERLAAMTLALRNAFRPLHHLHSYSEEAKARDAEAMDALCELADTCATRVEAAVEAVARANVEREAA
ncbi:hypothetical protein [Dokdonella soli]|uniref:Uncharacterized protein n=1 Tax=Dokdonella soli TaxID=529810 RepID=A0ABN1IUR2_9GAMM